MELQDSITTLTGVGPKKANALEKMKIRTIEDFLCFYPREYEDRRTRRLIADLSENEVALIRGKITLLVKDGFRYGKRKTLKLLVTDESGGIEIVFFNGGYFEKTLKREDAYEFYGRVTARADRLQMVHPDFHRYEGQETPGLLPVYPLTQGITQLDMRKWQKQAALCIAQIVDYLPTEIRERNRLCDLAYAISNIHFPTDPIQVKEAKYRLIFDELFLLQLGLLRIKRQFGTDGKGIAFDKSVAMEDLLRNLQFGLTSAQLRVIGEINRDMESNHCMNRLIQGDVGSGKTIVAAAAIYKAVKSGFQAVLMAPTELLARQHIESLSPLFQRLSMRVGILTGSLSQKDRLQVLRDLEEGNIDLCIGTHAILQPNVLFANLGLVITDEQHRFGVNQRKLLTQKGENPDVLVMTATPIPRTLAVVLYGDLDVSVIDEMPPGRIPIVTRAIDENSRDLAYEFLLKELKKGRQAYIVAPLIEDSESLDAKSANQLYEETKNRFPNFSVALLHGNLQQKEKDRIMEAFYQGDIQVLVSTVVIEVGINVPNASVMMIENAERFGLATLHQLRGRVGRGQHQSYCILLTEHGSDVSKERAMWMTKTNDGFVIAEKDLELRGPGEFFGMRQHGVPDLHLADLSKHLRIMEIARQEALNLLERDNDFMKNENRNLQRKINQMFGDTTIQSI